MIKFTTTERGILIEIPKDLICKIATEHPDDPMIIHDVDDLVDYIKDYLENNEDSETGLTGFQALIDQAIWSCYENEDFIESINDIS